MSTKQIDGEINKLKGELDNLNTKQEKKNLNHSVNYQNNKPNNNVTNKIAKTNIKSPGKILTLILILVISSGSVFGLTWRGGGFDRMFLDDNGNLEITGNFTVAQKVVFSFGEFVDNIVDDWLRLNGNVNVTGHLNISKNVSVLGTSLTVNNGTQQVEVCLEDGTHCQAKTVDTQKTTDGTYVYNDSNTVYFNESHMNNTIDSRANALERDTNITGDSIYLTDDGSVMDFNETLMNNTIETIGNATYVNTDGDTMTGDLNMSNSNVYLSNDQYLYFGDDKNASIRWDSANGRLVIKVN